MSQTVISPTMVNTTPIIPGTIACFIGLFVDVCTVIVLGRANSQQYRNHAVQYISYPHAKFDALRKSDPGK